MGPCGLERRRQREFCSENSRQLKVGRLLGRGGVLERGGAVWQTPGWFTGVVSSKLVVAPSSDIFEHFYKALMNLDRKNSPPREGNGVRRRFSLKLDKLLLDVFLLLFSKRWKWLINCQDIL